MSLAFTLIFENIYVVFTCTLITVAYPRLRVYYSTKITI